MKYQLLSVAITSIILQACNDSEGIASCRSAKPSVVQGQYFFDDYSGDLTYSPKRNNGVAVVCHNCYDNNVEDVSHTIRKITYAIGKGADIIELDVLFSKSNKYTPMISHEEDSSLVSFDEVIASEHIINASQLVFIEIKGEVTDHGKVKSILNKLKNQKNQFGDLAYFHSGRFTTIRSIEYYDTLSAFRDVLSEPEYSDIQPFVKLSRLHYKKSEPTLLKEINFSHQCGFHMVEFDIRTGKGELDTLSLFAKNLGLGVNVFTINEMNYQELIPTIKESFDVLTVEDHLKDEPATEKKSIYEKVKILIEAE